MFATADVQRDPDLIGKRRCLAVQRLTRVGITTGEDMPVADKKPAPTVLNHESGRSRKLLTVGVELEVEASDAERIDLYSRDSRVDAAFLESLAFVVLLLVHPALVYRCERQGGLGPRPG